MIWISIRVQLLVQQTVVGQSCSTSTLRVTVGVTCMLIVYSLSDCRRRHFQARSRAQRRRTRKPDVVHVVFPPPIATSKKCATGDQRRRKSQIAHRPPRKRPPRQGQPIRATIVSSHFLTRTQSNYLYCPCGYSNVINQTKELLAI
jgi:hypothetical protein